MDPQKAAALRMAVQQERGLTVPGTEAHRSRLTGARMVAQVRHIAGGGPLCDGPQPLQPDREISDEIQ
jgi:hypothetical protein